MLGGTTGWLSDSTIWHRNLVLRPHSNSVRISPSPNVPGFKLVDVSTHKHKRIETNPSCQCRHRSHLISGSPLTVIHYSAQSQMDVKCKFPTPFDWNVRDPVTLHELRMRKFVAMVQEKPRWWEKVFDDALVSKWKQEMQEYDSIAVRDEEHHRSVLWARLRPLRPCDISGEMADDLGDEPEEEEEDGDSRKRSPRDPVTALQLEWVFSFLKYSARQRDDMTGCPASSNPTVILRLETHVRDPCRKLSSLASTRLQALYQRT